MLMLDAKTILNRLPFTTLVDELATMHQQPIGQLDELLMTSEGARDTTNHFFIRTGWQQGKALGAKIITVFPDNNRGRSLPSIQAVYVLFEGRNGTPIACLDGTALTYIKTATDSALGCRMLARNNIETMLMIGAGEMAKYLITAHCEIRPSLQQVYIWNRTPEKAVQLCASDLASRFDTISFTPVTEIESLARKADLICSATSTPTPIIQGEWLQAGVHVDLIGAFTPEMREADDACLARASIFVDARETTINHIGELMIPIANEVISEDDVLADLSDLCQKKHPGRSSDTEITLYKNGGGGHLDLMLARIMHQHCQSEQASPC